MNTDRVITAQNSPPCSPSSVSLPSPRYAPSSLHAPSSLSAVSPLIGDLDRYRAHVAHLGLTPEREAELLVTVWQIMNSFVDRAFGDDPVQQVHGQQMRGQIVHGQHRHGDPEHGPSVHGLSGEPVSGIVIDGAENGSAVLRSEQLHIDIDNTDLARAFALPAAGRPDKDRL